MVNRPDIVKTIVQCNKTLLSWLLLFRTSRSAGVFKQFNPLVTNGFSHRYQLDGSIFIFRGVMSIF